MITGKRRYKNAVGFAETNNEIVEKRIKMMKDLNVID